jgi:hypothetical protein
VFRSSVAKLVTDVVRDDQQSPSGSPRSYLLIRDRSYGQDILDALRDPYAELSGDLRLAGDPGEARKAASSRRR